MIVTFRGYVARASTEILQLLNIGIAGAATATIVTSLYLEQPPSSIGWCFIAVAILAFIAGVFGVHAANHRAWFSWHLVALVVSVGGLVTAALVILTMMNQIVRNMNSKINYEDARNVVKLNGAIFFIMGGGQVVILVVAIVASCCEFVEYNEDIEMFEKGANLWSLVGSSKFSDKNREKYAKLAESMKQRYMQQAIDKDISGNKK